MKRICSLCLDDYPYHKVKKYQHKLQLCVKCQDVIVDLFLKTQKDIQYQLF